MSFKPSPLYTIDNLSTVLIHTFTQHTLTPLTCSYLRNNILIIAYMYIGQDTKICLVSSQNYLLEQDKIADKPISSVILLEEQIQIKIIISILFVLYQYVITVFLRITQKFTVMALYHGLLPFVYQPSLNVRNT